jgi:hypothetical protein
MQILIYHARIEAGDRQLSILHKLYHQHSLLVLKDEFTSGFSSLVPEFPAHRPIPSSNQLEATLDLTQTIAG